MHHIPFPTRMPDALNSLVRSGNLHGMLCVRTAQLTTKGDNRIAQAMRMLEEWLIALYRRLRIQPEAHRLAALAPTFIKSSVEKTTGRHRR